MREQPNGVYYIQRPGSQLYESGSFENIIHPIRTRGENTRFVKLTETGSDRDQTHYAPIFEESARRPSGLILPSIEGGIFDAKDQKVPFSTSQRTDRQLSDRREPLQQRAPSLFYVGNDGEQPHTKRRKVNEERHLKEQQPNTILVPLNGREGYSEMHSLPAAASHEDVPPFVLDKRIVQLPSRELKSYKDGRGCSQMLPKHGHFDDHTVHRMPPEQIETSYVIPEISGHSHSPRRSTAFHPVHDRKSPILFNGSAPVPREAPDSVSFPHHGSSTAGDGGRINSGLYGIKQIPRHFEEVPGQVQRDLRNLVIDPSPCLRQDVGMSVDIQSERDLLEAPGTVYLPVRTGEDTRADAVEERRKQVVYTEPMLSRSPRQRLVNQTDLRPIQQDIAMYEQCAHQRMEHEGSGYFGQHAPRPLPRRSDWSDL